MLLFTVNLADHRKSDLLAANIDALRHAIKTVKTNHPFNIDAIVVLPARRLGSNAQQIKHQNHHENELKKLLFNFDLTENMDMLGMTAQPTEKEILWNIGVCELQVDVTFLR